LETGSFSDFACEDFKHVHTNVISLQLQATEGTEVPCQQSRQAVELSSLAFSVIGWCHSWTKSGWCQIYHVLGRPTSASGRRAVVHYTPTDCTKDMHWIDDTFPLCPDGHPLEHFNSTYRRL